MRCPTETNKALDTYVERDLAVPNKLLESHTAKQSVQP